MQRLVLKTLAINFLTLYALAKGGPSKQERSQSHPNIRMDKKTQQKIEDINQWNMQSGFNSLTTHK